MRPILNGRRREGRAKHLHPRQTRTTVVDAGRNPDRRHSHNRRTTKLGAVGYRNGIADGQVRRRLTLGYVEADGRPWLVSHARCDVDGLPHAGLNVR